MTKLFILRIAERVSTIPQFWWIWRLPGRQRIRQAFYHVTFNTPISTSTDKISEEAEDVINTYKRDLERQKRNVPQAINSSWAFFGSLLGHITHEAILLIFKELILAKKWITDMEEERSQPASGSGCEKGCDLPSQTQCAR